MYVNKRNKLGLSCAKLKFCSVEVEVEIEVRVEVDVGFEVEAGIEVGVAI